MNNPQNNISFLIPIYNEENRVKYILKLYDNLHKMFNDSFEIICILNGCTDKTFEVLSKIINKRNIKIIFLPKKSRGSAVKKGISVSNSKFIAISSVDNAWNISFYKIAYELLLNNSDLCIIYGPKTHSSSRVNRPKIRIIISFLCSIYLKILFGKLFTEDTQCIKMFKRESIIFLNKLSNANYFSEAEFYFLSKKFKIKSKSIQVDVSDSKKYLKPSLMIGFIFDAFIFRIKLLFY